MALSVTRLQYGCRIVESWLSLGFFVEIVFLLNCTRSNESTFSQAIEQVISEVLTTVAINDIRLS
jgi:hypothetical protein